MLFNVGRKPNHTHHRTLYHDPNPSKNKTHIMTNPKKTNPSDSITGVCSACMNKFDSSELVELTEWKISVARSKGYKIEENPNIRKVIGVLGVSIEEYICIIRRDFYEKGLNWPICTECSRIIEGYANKRWWQFWK